MKTHPTDMVARGRAVREANHDAEGARRAKIDPGRFESMDRWLRQLALRASVVALLLG